MPGSPFSYFGVTICIACYSQQAAVEEQKLGGGEHHHEHHVMMYWSIMLDYYRARAVR